VIRRPPSCARPRGRRTWDMSHSESDEEYYSALEEESPRPRVMAMVRIRERRSRLDGALAMVRQRRQLEEKGRYCACKSRASPRLLGNG